MVMPPHEDEGAWVSEHELEYPDLYLALDHLIRRYGYTNVQQALDNINDEG